MMRFRKIFCILLLAQTFSIPAIAQEGEKPRRPFNHFLEIGMGMNFYAVRDLATSPLIYKGYQPAFHLQYFLTNPRYIGIIDENFSFGKLKNRNFSSRDDNKARSYSNELSFTALYNFRNFERSTLYLGGELGTVANIRLNDKFNNANLNYEFFVSLSPSVLYEYRTSWKAGRHNLGLFTMKKRDRNFKMQYMLTVPVVTTLLRPGYITISDFVDENNLMVDMENIRAVSFNHLFLVKNKFNLYYILHNNNMLKFNYILNYYSYYGNYNPVKGFNSAFLASIVFRFSNN